MSFLSSIIASAGSGSSMISTTLAPSLMLLMRNGPMQLANAAQQPMRRSVSHLHGSSSGAASKVERDSATMIKRPGIPRGTAATHLRSFAAQPALSEDNQMFCVSPDLG
jgi:hypothetical protein